MLKFYRILLLTLVAVFLASTAGIARYAADSCTQARMYRQGFGGCEPAGNCEDAVGWRKVRLQAVGTV